MVKVSIAGQVGITWNHKIVSNFVKFVLMYEEEIGEKQIYVLILSRAVVAEHDYRFDVSVDV